jgi:hypothetical protein
VKKELENCGAWVFNVHGHAMQRAGVPDLYVAHRKFHGWLELKVDNNSCSTLQKIVLRDLNARGVAAYVLRMKKGKTTLEDCDGEVVATIEANLLHVLSSFQE